MASTKSREPISAADIPRIFDDACVDELAAGRLPAAADRKCFAEGVREAARIYAPARPGPFAQIVGKCLELVGASHADAVGLINELNRRRIQSRLVSHQN